MSAYGFDNAQPSRPGRRFSLAMRLAGRPGFCCCCLVLAPSDVARMRRVLSIVRRLKKMKVKALARKQANNPKG